MIIPISYYQNSDVVFLAKDLLGKILFTKFDDILTGGIITETEAYAGTNDKASHAYNGRRTARNEVMYLDGGVSYAYLCYGIHNLFNIVTGKKDQPHAILIRGIYPIAGWDQILIRSGKPEKIYKVTNGPGKVSKALGIKRSNNGISLDGNQIWLEDQNFIPKENDILRSKRVGIDYAEEDAELLYRFNLTNIDF